MMHDYTLDEIRDEAAAYLETCALHAPPVFCRPVRDAQARIDEAEFCLADEDEYGNLVAIPWGYVLKMWQW